jgi:hypothetical protein
MQNNKIEQRGSWFFYFAMIWLVYRFWGNTLFSQLAEPVLVFPSIDNTFWLFHVLNIPAFISQHQFVATIFDLLLFFFPILFIKTQNKWFAVALRPPYFNIPHCFRYVCCASFPLVDGINHYKYYVLDSR